MSVLPVQARVRFRWSRSVIECLTVVRFKAKQRGFAFSPFFPYAFAVIVCKLIPLIKPKIILSLKFVW